MNNFILSISPDRYSDKLNLSESLGFGGQMVLLGMGAVFAVLGIIWVLLTVFKSVFNKIENQKKASEVKNDAPIEVAAPTYTSDSEIVAVIAAAITMAENDNENDVKFKVVSFRRK